MVCAGTVSHVAAAAKQGGSWGVEGRTEQEGKKVFRWGRGLRTSFNSTLLWKLQLPLSRLAPWPNPSALALFATQTTPTGLHPQKNPGEIRGGLHAFRRHPNTVTQVGVCVFMCIWSSKPFTCTKKGTLKTFGEDKKNYERPDFNIFLSLHCQDYSKVYWEAGQAGEGAWHGQVVLGGWGRMKELGPGQVKKNRIEGKH